MFLYTSSVVAAAQVLHVYGTPYQMGLAYGQLMNKEINEIVPDFFNYFYSQIGAQLLTVCAKYGVISWDDIFTCAP